MPPLKDHRKQDKDLKNIVDDCIEETKDNEEFEAFLNLDKNLPSPAIEKILKKLEHIEDGLMQSNRENIKTRIAVVDLKDNITNKRVEIVNLFLSISASLVWIKKHVAKWFWSVLIVAIVFAFTMGGLANENKETIYPLAGKAINAWDNWRKVKNVTQ